MSLITHWPQIIWAAYVLTSLANSLLQDHKKYRSPVRGTLVWAGFQLCIAFVLFEGGFFSQIGITP